MEIFLLNGWVYKIIDKIMFIQIPFQLFLNNVSLAFTIYAF